MGFPTSAPFSFYKEYIPYSIPCGNKLNHCWKIGGTSRNAPPTRGSPEGPLLGAPGHLEVLKQTGPPPAPADHLPPLSPRAPSSPQALRVPHHSR